MINNLHNYMNVTSGTSLEHNRHLLFFFFFFLISWQSISIFNRLRDVFCTTVQFRVRQVLKADPQVSARECMNNRSKWCSVFLYPYIWIKVISVIPYQKRMSTGPSSPTVCARYVFWYDESRVRHLWQYACRWCLCHVTGGLITNIINWLQFFS